MSFRSKLLLAFVPLVLIPLGVLALGVRTVLNDRFHDQFQSQLSSLVSSIASDLSDLDMGLSERIGAIGDAAAADNRFRASLIPGSEDRVYMLDYAGYAMTLSGLAALQIQDAEGRILSSGHFRNEFDRNLPLLGRQLQHHRGGIAIAPIGTAAGGFLAIVRADSFRIGTNWLHVTAGVALADLVETWERSSEDIGVDVHVPDLDSVTVDQLDQNVIIDSVAVPFLMADSDPSQSASIVLAHSVEPLRILQRQVDKWSAIVFGMAAAVTLIVAGWIASRISRPLAELADRTASLDLDRLDVQFTTDRRDEIGSLTRLLGSMVSRLRSSTARLRDAERRAAVGDIARQVNHDIKNGLVPIRNVVHHLNEVRDTPSELARVFGERSETIHSSIAYLEKLASHYARLTPGRDAGACDVGEVVEDVLRGLDVPVSCHIRFRTADRIPTVRGDRLALRRVVENLVGNAVDSLEGLEGAVTLMAEEQHRPTGSVVMLTVSDTGCGMRSEELDKAFQDFYTTKPTGTGLGLSVVRRLIGDLGGSLRIETEPAKGTTVFVDLPIAQDGLVAP